MWNHKHMNDSSKNYLILPGQWDCSLLDASRRIERKKEGKGSKEEGGWGAEVGC